MNYDNELDRAIKEKGGILELEIPNKWLGRGAAIITAGWLASGIYFVGPTGEGVETRFGKYTATTTSGLHWHMPWPIEKVTIPEVTNVRRLEVGFKTVDQATKKFEKVDLEAHMLTGDENIVDLEAIVQYNIVNARDYLFNCRDVEGTIKDASEAALRQVVGDNGIDMAMTYGKTQIQDMSKLVLQNIIKGYNCGVQITAVQLQDVDPPREVKKAFDDVPKAKEDRDKSVNIAQAYSNDVIPKARGEAAQMIEQAKGYKAQQIEKAKGDTNRFTQILTEYRKAPEITAQRMYIDTMQTVYPNMDVTFIDGKLGSVLPVLGLNKTEKLEKIIKGGQK
mgnify:CR=1 FL=1